MTAFFVQLSPELQDLIVIGLTFVVSFLLLKLAEVPALKWLADYLGEYKTQIIVWASGLVFQFLNGLLTNVPLEWEPVAVLVMQLIVAIAAVFGAFNFLSNRGVRGLK